MLTRDQWQGGQVQVNCGITVPFYDSKGIAGFSAPCTTYGAEKESERERESSQRESSRSASLWGPMGQPSVEHTTNAYQACLGYPGIRESRRSSWRYKCSLEVLSSLPVQHPFPFHDFPRLVDHVED